MTRRRCAATRCSLRSGTAPFMARGSSSSPTPAAQSTQEGAVCPGGRQLSSLEMPLLLGIYLERPSGAGWKMTISINTNSHWSRSGR
eukprot:6197360-Pleurochrysis_carterae.AAC.1